MILWLVACSFDSRTSLVDLQVVGTHNSYHVSTIDFDPWNYTHPPLDEQVELGLGQFELDVWWNGTNWDVYHIRPFDPGSHCETLELCLDALLAGSDRVPSHLPLVVMLETKTETFDAIAYQALEDRVASVDESRRISPPEIRGESGTLRDSMLGGFPVLSGQRGRMMFVVHDRGDWGAAARDSELVFADAYGDLQAEWAVFHSVNDPFDPLLIDVVEAKHLSRTRTDVDMVEVLANDTVRRDQALSTGATFLSTDAPIAHPETGYVVTIP